MSLLTDRDLLLAEPTLFADLPILAQQRISVTDGSLIGTTLTSSAADFTAAQVSAGSVVLVSGLAHEVVARLDAHTLTVSLPRTLAADDPIPSTLQGTGLSVVSRTFAPQADIVHHDLLRAIGLDPDGQLEQRPALGESSLVSIGAMSRLQALALLARLYAAGAALVGDNQSLWAKARHYHDRFAEARRAASILIDADGDGLADQRRRFAAATLERT